MSDTTDTVMNRSEIVFLYDAVDANPNGNPLSGANRPRIDPQTQQAIVTDVRLKRYLRDQLDDDGHGVYIRNVQEEGNQFTRGELLEDRLKAVDYDNYDLDDDEEADQFREDVFGEFLDKSVDVRYFGATMSNGSIRSAGGRSKIRRSAGARSAKNHGFTVASSTPTRVFISAASTEISNSIPLTRKPRKNCGRSEI